MKYINTVNVLVDNESWVLPYAQQLVDWCTEQSLSASLVCDQNNLGECDVSFFLGCVELVSNENLAKSQLNLVVHESDLPHGKGFAPVAWQILEGRHEVPVCLLEATEEADSGLVWLRDIIVFDGTELCAQWRHLQGEVTLRLCKKFLQNYATLQPNPQIGAETRYSRRRPRDSELDVDRSIAEQFELLRVVDNKHYPAFFKHRNKTYKIEISEYDDERI